MSLQDKVEGSSEVPAADEKQLEHWDRRRFLLGSAAVGIGGAVAAAVHDGELGGPSQTIRGSIPWQEGTADAPPGVSGFQPANIASICMIAPFSNRICPIAMSSTV